MTPIDRDDPATKRRLTLGECMTMAPPEHLTSSERRALASWAQWTEANPHAAAGLEALVGRRVALRQTMGTWWGDVETSARRYTPPTRQGVDDAQRFSRRDRWPAGSEFHVVARFGDRVLGISHNGPAAHNPPDAVLLRAEWVRALPEGA